MNQLIKSIYYVAVSALVSAAWYGQESMVSILQDNEHIDLDAVDAVLH